MWYISTITFMDEPIIKFRNSQSRAVLTQSLSQWHDQVLFPSSELLGKDQQKMDCLVAMHG